MNQVEKLPANYIFIRTAPKMTLIKEKSGDLVAAINYHTRALYIDRQLANHKGILNHTLNLGRIYFQIG